MAHRVCELLWIRNLLGELGFKPKHAMQLNCDNKTAIDIAHNPVQHDRTKHVEVDKHFIKEKLEAKIIEVPFVKSEDQLADVLTKAVIDRVFHGSLSKLGIDDNMLQLEGECQMSCAFRISGGSKNSSRKGQYLKD
ncbi:unnamed protein product [Prunus armeniaca]